MAGLSRQLASSPRNIWVRLCQWLWRGLQFFWIIIVLGLVVNIAATWLITKGFDPKGTPLEWIAQHLSLALACGGGLLVLTVLAGVVSDRYDKQNDQAPQQKREPTTVWNVPYRRNPFFTGRESVLTQLHKYFTQTRTAALTQPAAITGLGGIGKTQIAVEYAYRYKDEHNEVLWVNATSRETLTESFVSIAGLLTLPVKDEQDQRLTIAAVQQWFVTHRKWLLILDNADDSTLVGAFLPPGDHGHILLTTRRRAWGTLAQGFEVEKMGQMEGMLFLLRRAKVLRTPHTLLAEASHADQTMAQAIVQELDGLPLALDQAGAYIEETPSTVEGYLKAYRHRQQEILQERANEQNTYPASVATTWSLNFEQVERLNAAAADLLRCLAFLAPDAIPEEMIVAGACELGHQLQTLADDETLLDTPMRVLGRFSLVQRQTDNRLLFIHRLVQAVFRGIMIPDTQREWAERTVRVVDRAFPSISPVEFFEEAETRTQCERLLPHALACAEFINKYALEFPEAACLLNRAGDYLNSHAHQYEQAKPLLERALAIREHVQEPNLLDIAQSLNSLAVLYNNQGNYEQAKPLYKRALTLTEQALSPHHPETARSLIGLATLYKSEGNYEQAKPLLERALAIQEQMLGSNHLDTAQSLNNLAVLYSIRHNYEQAKSLLERALAIREQVQGASHPDTLTCLNNLAFLYMSQHNYKQARLLFEQVLATRKQVLGSNHLHTARSLSSLAELYNRQGKYRHARRLLERALAIMEKTLGPNHPDTKFVRENYERLF